MEEKTPAIMGLFQKLRSMPHALTRARGFLNAAGHGFGDVSLPIICETTTIEPSTVDDADVLTRLQAAWLIHHGPSPRETTESRIARANTRVKESAKYLDPEIPRALAKDYIYLDVGSAEGDITAAVVAHLHLPRERAIAVDVIDATSATHLAYRFLRIDGVHIPVEPQTVDLITMFMSAHHFEHADTLFTDVARVALPGARLVMREHSLADAESSTYYDFVHAFYAAVQSAETTPVSFAEAYANGKYANYRSPVEWVRLAERVGFTCVDMTTPKKDSFDSFRMLFIRGDAAEAARYEADAQLRAQAHRGSRAGVRGTQRGSRVGVRGPRASRGAGAAARNLEGEWRAAGRTRGAE